LAQPVEKCANGAAAVQSTCYTLLLRLSAVWRDFEKVKVESVEEIQEEELQSWDEARADQYTVMRFQQF